MEDVQSRDLNLHGPVFDMEVRRGLRSQLELFVDFSQQVLAETINFALLFHSL